MVSTTGDKIEVRCPQCDRLLCRVDGLGTEVEIKCRCGCIVVWPDTAKARIIVDNANR